MKSFHAILSLLFLASLLAAVNSSAGEATFSRTGKAVYLLGQETPLNRLDLDTGKLVDITVPGLPDAEGIRSLAISNAGFILCLSKSAVYAWDDVTGKDAVVVCRAPENLEFLDLAYNPSDSSIAVTTRLEPTEPGARPEWGLHVKSKDGDRLVRVRCRRILAISNLAFDREGALHFSSEGDLWAGKIARPGDSPYLKAFRHTPLATRETNEGTGDQMGADPVAVTDTMIYAHVRRMGGSGWGHVIRLRKAPLPEPEANDFKMPFELDDRLAIYRDQLATVEILGENGTRSYLCVSPDRKTVYFRARRDAPGEPGGHWLIRDGGEPEALEVSETE